MRKILIGFAGGVVLIALLWLLNTFIAFVIFNRETDIWLVLPAWFWVDASVYVILMRLNLIDRYINIGAAVFIILLVVMYLVPARANFPREALTLNERVNASHENKYRYAEKLFFIIEKRWTSPVRQYMREPHKVFFIKSAEYYWRLESGEYVDSNVQAHLYRNLLLMSGRFGPDEIMVEQHWCTNSPHGVVVFRKNGEKFYADLWAVDNFENYKFGQYTAAPCDTLSGDALEIKQ